MVKSKKAAQKLARKSTRAGPKDVKNNPFEIHTNKRKHDILGRKLKNDRGLPGISRSKAIKKVGITSCEIDVMMRKAGVGCPQNEVLR